MVFETCEISGDTLKKELPPDAPQPKDLRPEYCQYRDEGCEYARSCLECPFPRCLFEEPRGRQRWMKQTRDREIKRLYDGGKKVKELATIFSVSQRTIQRALKRKR
ncbi:MAG: hypothetical protein PHG35_06990 [Dehalococcoidales bacterium]|nr:hypothetical protein [Dehalococcoidales bacterium]